VFIFDVRCGILRTDIKSGSSSPFLLVCVPSICAHVDGLVFMEDMKKVKVRTVRELYGGTEEEPIKACACAASFSLSLSLSPSPLLSLSVSL
jgi:hypothetical protein